jgi:biopolymer transport protein TolR
MEGSNNGKKFMSDINVTPFVDVMLVLLIIFMVTAPLMIQGVDVNLPQTTAQEINTQQDPLILTVNKNLEISLQDSIIKLEDLEEKLNAIFKYSRDKEVLLRADKDVPVGYFIKVIAGVKRAGKYKIGIVTEPED